METKYRICKICNKNKELFTEFYFHSATGYYFGHCIECHNQKRREKKALLPKKERKKQVKFKCCIKCSERKQIGTNTFPKLGKKFSSVCLMCNEEDKKERLDKRLHVGNLPVETIKQCIACKKHQEISNFSFNKSIGYYASYCKPCDVKRKQERNNSLSIDEKERVKQRGRDWHRINRHLSLSNVYRKFDFNKGLENNLTTEYIKEQILKPCSYCGHPSTGLDRIDNTKGHLQNNCIPCCWECNTARNDNFSYNEMLIIGKAIKQVKDGRLIP